MLAGYRIRYRKANDPLPAIFYSFRMDTRVPEELGDRIRMARDMRGWTQEELGRRISVLIGRTPGYGKAAVNKWENGTTIMPPADAIWAMEQLFNIPHDLLLWGPDKKPRPKRALLPPGRRTGATE